MVEKGREQVMPENHREEVQFRCLLTSTSQDEVAELYKKLQEQELLQRYEDYIRVRVICI